MGTADFAVPALQKLIDSAHEIAAVYTAPPKPAGRGKNLRKSPVHELAESHNLPVQTPASLKNETLPECDLAVVAAYGILLPKSVLQAPKFGCINIHPSLLPRWRGAAPIQRTIMAGDKETGVCIMQMDEGLDTGAILAMEKLPLAQKITAGELHDICAEQGAEMILRVIDDIENFKPTAQSEQGATYAKKITGEDEKISWTKTAREIECQIRGLNPSPGAYFEYGDEKIRVLAADITNETGKPGTVLDDKLTIACGSGALKITALQRPGKRAMTAQEFLNGYKIAKAKVLN